MIITPELLKRYNVNGPRYTSYPTADKFNETFTEKIYIDALNNLDYKNRISLYIHVPFCANLCYYCACNKIITKHQKKADIYLDYLEREIILQTQYFKTKFEVIQLHVGGGTPTFLNNEQLSRLNLIINKYFNLDKNGEFSIEIDPRTVNFERLNFLKELGFNRLSFGVQDFDFEVQNSVKRVQSFEQVLDLISFSRKLKFLSINIDLIYGLPKQTIESFNSTLNKIIQIKPDRIALYSYAHLPERFKSQRRILFEDLPSPESKLKILYNALSVFNNNGYNYIGMDHFALENDSLSLAKKQGKLQRNFQGYSTLPDCDLIALGVSAIGKINNIYSQNAKTLEDYYNLIDNNKIPIKRGLVLNKDDLLRRFVIMSIMCQGELNFNELDNKFQINSRDYFQKEIEILKDKQTENLIILDDKKFKSTDLGWFFIRGIASVFDYYLQNKNIENNNKFSKII